MEGGSASKILFLSLYLQEFSGAALGMRTPTVACEDSGMLTFEAEESLLSHRGASVEGTLSSGGPGHYHC